MAKKKPKNKSTGKKASPGSGSESSGSGSKVVRLVRGVLGRPVVAGIGLGLAVSLGLLFGRLAMNGDSSEVDGLGGADANEISSEAVSSDFQSALKSTDKTQDDLKAGVALLQRERYADAVRVLLRYARSDSFKGEAERITLYSGLSEGYRGLGNDERAKIYSRKARKLVEQSGVSLRLFERAEGTRTSGHFEEARKIYYRYLLASGDPDDEDNELNQTSRFRIADCFRDQVLALGSWEPSPASRTRPAGDEEATGLLIAPESETEVAETSEADGGDVVFEEVPGKRRTRYRVLGENVSAFELLTAVGEGLGLQILTRSMSSDLLSEETLTVDLEGATREDLLEFIGGALDLDHEFGSGFVVLSPRPKDARGLSERAVSAYRLALGNFPRSGHVADARLSMGSLFYRAENYREATDSYLTLVNEYADHEQVPFALLQAARGAMKQEAFSKARDFAFEIVEAHARSDAILPACEIIVLGFIEEDQFDRANRCLEFFARRFEVLWEFADVEFRLARALLEKDFLERGQALLEKLLRCPHFEQSETDEIALLHLQILVKMEKVEEAVVSLNREIRKPNSLLAQPQWKLLMGEVFLKSGLPFFAFAMGEHLRMVSADEEVMKSADLLRVRGLADLGLLGRATEILEEGFEDFAEAVEESEVILLDFARHSLELEDFSRAEEVYRRLTRVEGTRARAWLGLARLAFAQEQYDKALSILRGRIDKTDSDLRSEVCLLAADCFRRLGLEDAAVLALNGFLGERMP